MFEQERELRTALWEALFSQCSVLREHRGGNERFCLEQMARTRSSFTSDMGFKGWIRVVPTRKGRKKNQS